MADDGNCMFNAILKTLHFFNDYDRERELYSAIHLRRQLITHMVGHIDLLYPAVKQGILENYGWKEEYEDPLPKVGPFSIYSWAMYMKDNLVWGDSIILSLLASMWSVRVTIVGSRTLYEVRFRHDLDLEFTDIALVFNTPEGNDHYSGLIRRNQEVCATRRLTGVAERLSLFQDGALQVLKKSEVHLSIIKSSTKKALEGKGKQLAKIEKVLKREERGRRRFRGRKCQKKEAGYCCNREKHSRSQSR